MNSPAARRRSFRRRLLTGLGAALAVALTLVGAVVWGGAALWATADAREALRREADVVARAVVLPDGTLDARRYDWDEPHHRFSTPRIDPYFLQVFSPAGRLLRASDNVAAFAPDRYPDRALPGTRHEGAFSPLATFRLGNHRLYHITEPLRDRQGRVVGFVQIARFVPPLYSGLGRLGGGLALALATLLAALLGVVWIVGGRVVRPLDRLTRHAAGLSAATLGQRARVPPEADQETAALAFALNDALDRLDAAFDEMKRFTSNAAHELQTPLTVLRGHIEVALRRDRSADAYRDTLRLLDGEVLGMIETVRALLTLARLDAADRPFPAAAVDLAALARDEAEALQDRAREKGLTLSVEAGRSLPVEGHESLLRDVVRNLLDNAIKYTPEGRVAVTTSGRGGEAWLRVEDTGPGIPAAQRRHAVGRFWRTRSAQHLPGSGLGLALADGIARRHGGRLVLADSPLGGLCAALVLPLARQAPHRVADEALA